MAVRHLDGDGAVGPEAHAVARDVTHVDGLFDHALAGIGDRAQRRGSVVSRLHQLLGTDGGGDGLPGLKRLRAHTDEFEPSGRAAAPASVALDGHGGPVQEIRLADEIRDEAGGRRVIQLGRAAHLLDPAALHHGHAVRHGQGLFLVVGHVEHRDAQVLLDVLELELHVGTELLVERAERLVHQEHARPEDERPRQCHPLLLAARELARQTVLVAGEADHLERFRDAVEDLQARHRANLQRERDVIEDGEVREHRVALEDHAQIAALRGQRGHRLAVHEHLAAGGIGEARHHHERRGLAGAAGPEQGEEGARGHGDGDIAHRDHRPEGLGQLVESNFGSAS